MARNRLNYMGMRYASYMVRRKNGFAEDPSKSIVAPGREFPRLEPPSAGANATANFE